MKHIPSLVLLLFVSVGIQARADSVVNLMGGTVSCGLNGCGTTFFSAPGYVITNVISGEPDNGSLGSKWAGIWNGWRPAVFYDDLPFLAEC